MGYRFVRKGLNEIAKLSSLGSKTLKEEIFEEVGTTVQNYAKRNAPVDTGKLRQSINHYSNDKAAIIGSMVKYAAVREYVNKLHPSTIHYLKRGFTEHKDEILKKVKTIIKNHLS